LDAKAAAQSQCVQYCSSDEPEVQAKFFAINPELEAFRGELGLDNTDCSAIMPDISKCSQSFKDEFNSMLNQLEAGK
jgi:hypothetical protein